MSPLSNISLNHGDQNKSLLLSILYIKGTIMVIVQTIVQTTEFQDYKVIKPIVQHPNA